MIGVVHLGNSHDLLVAVQRKAAVTELSALD